MASRYSYDLSAVARVKLFFLVFVASCMPLVDLQDLCLTLSFNIPKVSLVYPG